MTEPRLSRHVVYHQVLDALGQEGCPVCRLGLRAVSRHLDVLSYENVNDPRTRSELRAARGFCNWHAWQFAEEIHDGLGTAIIYRDIIGELLDVLGARRQRSRWGGALSRAPDFPRALADRLAPQQECPACRCLRQSSGRYLDTLIAQIPESAFRARYLASDGLCLPHLLTGLRNLVGPYHDLLTQAFGQRLAALAGTLDSGRGPAKSSAVEARVGKAGAIIQPAQDRTEPLATGHTGDEATPQAAGSCEEGCPVCWSAGAAVGEWLVEMSSTHTPIEHQGAFLCNRHAWQWYETAVARKTSRLLQRELLRVESALRALPAIPTDAGMAARLRSLLGHPSARPAVDALVENLALDSECPACAVWTQAERRTVLAILRHPDLDTVARLCQPHFRLVLRLSPGYELALIFTHTQIEALQRLYGELSEYVRKQDYRFRHEPLGTEANAPWSAIGLLAGDREAI